MPFLDQGSRQVQGRCREGTAFDCRFPKPLPQPHSRPHPALPLHSGARALPLPALAQQPSCRPPLISHRLSLGQVQGPGWPACALLEQVRFAGFPLHFRWLSDGLPLGFHCLSTFFSLPFHGLSTAFPLFFHWLFTGFGWLCSSRSVVGPGHPLVPCPFHLNLPRLSPRNLCGTSRNLEGETLGGFWRQVWFAQLNVKVSVEHQDGASPPLCILFSLHRSLLPLCLSF